MRAGRAQQQRQTGFIYVAVMAILALVGAGLAAIGPMWSDSARREREQELLHIGALYAEAISAYYNTSPGSAKRFPPNLASLVLDTRFVGLQRHIRKLYLDPLDPARDWGVVRAPDGGVQGVYSLDERAPYTRVALDLGSTSLPAAEHYSDWKFVPKALK